MPLAPGARVGPYEIVAPLGAGGMGEVYRGLDTRLSRSVALTNPAPLRVITAWPERMAATTASAR